MRESGVGRVLVASLHQAIGEHLPTRLGFYESWMSPDDLRAGTIGLAPLNAVFSFLRQEGEAYDRVVTRAGEYAAEWTVASMTPVSRRLLGTWPRFVRRRLVLGRACGLVRLSFEGNRASWRIRKGIARVDIRQSVFCTVRQPVAHPLCGYYAAMVRRMLQLFDLDADVTIESCRGMGADGCRLRQTVAVPAEASSEEHSAQLSASGAEAAAVDA